MSIIYNTLERLESLEKLEKAARENHAHTDRPGSGNTKAEAHHPDFSTATGLSTAFKIVISILLCLGGTAFLMLRTSAPVPLSYSFLSQSPTMELGPSSTAIPRPFTGETAKPAPPVMVSTEMEETDGTPAGHTTEPESQPDDPLNQLDNKLEVASELTPARVIEVDSVVTGLLQAEDVALPAASSEVVPTTIALSDSSVELAEAEKQTGDAQPADGQVNAEASPAQNTTAFEILPDPMGQSLEQARLALSRGQYFQALAVMESIPEVPENRADYWLIKGSVHLGLGQLDLAEESFESAHALVPGHAQTQVQLAVLKQEKGDHAGALSLLKDAARRHRDVPEIYLNLGYSQQALGEIDEAGRSFTMFLELTEGRSVYSEQRKMVSQWVSRGSAEVGSIVDAR